MSDEVLLFIGADVRRFERVGMVSGGFTGLECLEERVDEDSGGGRMLYAYKVLDVRNIIGVILNSFKLTEGTTLVKESPKGSSSVKLLVGPAVGSLGVILSI